MSARLRRDLARIIARMSRKNSLAYAHTCHKKRNKENGGIRTLSLEGSHLSSCFRKRSIRFEFSGTVTNKQITSEAKP